MKKIFLPLIMSLLLMSCATTDKVGKNTINNELFGQNEMLVLKRLGAPTRVTQTSDEGKIMVYEHYSKGMFLTPNKSNISYRAPKNTIGSKHEIAYTSNINKATNDPAYTIYPTNVSYLKVFINKQGNCFRIVNTLPQEQLEVYHERFKHFKTKD